MKDIKNNINSLEKMISNVEDSKYKEIFSSISNILNSLHTKIEEIMVNEAVLAENFKYMDQDISDIQEELFEEVSIEDLEEMEETFTEVQCEHCGKPIYIEESALKENKEIKCPYCNENIQ